jgi:hypothetical protein
MKSFYMERRMPLLIWLKEQTGDRGGPGRCEEGTAVATQWRLGKSSRLKHSVPPISDQEAGPGFQGKALERAGLSKSRRGKPAGQEKCPAPGSIQ